MKTLVGPVFGKRHWKIRDTVRPFTRSKIELAFIQEPTPVLLDTTGAKIGHPLQLEQDAVTGETHFLALLDSDEEERVGFGQRPFIQVGIPEFGQSEYVQFWLKPILSEHSRPRVEASTADGPMVGRPDHLLVFSDAKLAAVQIVTKPTVWGTAPCQLDVRDITEGSGLGGHSWVTTPSHKDVLERSARYLHRYSRSAVSFTPLGIACIDPLVAILPRKPAPKLDLKAPLRWESRQAMEKGRKAGQARRTARLAAAPVETQAMDLVRRQRLKAGLPDPGDPLAPKKATPGRRTEGLPDALGGVVAHAYTPPPLSSMSEAEVQEWCRLHPARWPDGRLYDPKREAERARTTRSVATRPGSHRT